MSEDSLQYKCIKLARNVYIENRRLKKILPRIEAVKYSKKGDNLKVEKDNYIWILNLIMYKLTKKKMEERLNQIIPFVEKNKRKSIEKELEIHSLKELIVLNEIVNKKIEENDEIFKKTIKILEKNILANRKKNLEKNTKTREDK